MPTFDLDASFARAAERFARPARHRSDRGIARLARPLEQRLQELLGTDERPRPRDVMRDLAAWARRAGIQPPARATLYNAIERARPASYRMRELPHAVQAALYNVADDAEVTGELVAFYAFNHGDMRAVCWAAGMPWLALHHAARMRGWRPKSRGLLVAAMRRRGIA
jgi:hypothetical protein